MTKGRYRHCDTTDTDLLVFGVQQASDGLKVRGALVNRYNGEVYEVKTYLLKTEDLSKWSLIRAERTIEAEL